MQTHFFLIATMLAGAFAVPSGPGAALAERDTNHHEVGLNSPRALPVEVEKRQVDLSSICSLLTSLGVQSASTICELLGASGTGTSTGGSTLPTGRAFRA